MHRFLPLLAGPLVVAALAGCRTPGFAPPQGDSTLVERVGSRDFTLSASAGTGFEWTATSSDPAVASIGEAVRKDVSSGPGGYAGRPVGGPMQWVFPVTFHTPGKAALRFQLARSWEKNTPPAEVRVVEVTVE